MQTLIAPPLRDTLAGARAAQALRACVHCGFCNATCPTYQLTGDELDGPRGRIYLMKATLEGGEISRLTQVHLDRCLGCRACETTCPSGVAYHRLYDVGRAYVDARVRRPLGERLARTLIRAVVPHPARFGALVGLGRVVRPLLPAPLKSKLPAARPVPATPKVAHPRTMLLLKGCAQSAVAPQFNAATARVFDRVGISLAEAPQAGCCGALSAHLGAHEEARAFARRNIDAWRGPLDWGAEAIVVNASGCAAFLKDYPDLLADDPAYAAEARRIADLVRDPVEVLERAGLAPSRAPASPRIAVHDPCTLQHGLKLGGRVAPLLARLGFDPQQVADAHICCGSAGAYSLLQPDLAGRLREAKLHNLMAGAPAAIYTGNIGCWMHLDAASPVPVRHWIEAVDEVTVGSAPNAP